MKKLIVMFATLTILFGPCRLATAACDAIWNQVSGHDFTMTAGGTTFNISFENSWSGPCPQGDVIISNKEGEEVATCHYIARGDSVVEIDCGGQRLFFLLFDGWLINIPPNALHLAPAEAAK